MRASFCSNEAGTIETMISKPLSFAYSGLDDDRLAAEVKNDNPGAFAALYDRYLTPVYRYLVCRVNDIPTAEDLTTQVFLTALERFSQYRGHGKFAAWLFTIARNKSIDFFRSSRREIPLENCPVQNLIDEDRTCAGDEAGYIRALIAKFPPDERELLDMRFAAEMSFGEMAQALHRSENAVKKQVYRLLERIRKELENGHE